MCLAIFISWLFIFMIGVSRKCLANNMCQLTLMTSAQNVLERCPSCVKEVSELNFFFLIVTQLNCVGTCWRCVWQVSCHLSLWHVPQTKVSMFLGKHWHLCETCWRVRHLSDTTLVMHAFDTCWTGHLSSVNHVEINKHFFHLDTLDTTWTPLRHSWSTSQESKPTPILG